MKKVISIFIASILLSACSAEIGSKEWCVAMQEKSSNDWTATETKDYAKHCIF